MPRVGEIEAALFKIAPRECAMEWDNVGLLVGKPGREVKKILVSLDITEAVAEEAHRWGADLIVSHHPVIFHGQKRVTDQDVTGRILLRLMECNLSAICMHTNLDIAEGGVNDTLAEWLSLRDVCRLEDTGVVRVGTLDAPMALTDFVRYISQRLNCNGVRYADAGRRVHRVGVGGGACGEFEDAAIAAGCDTYVTADLSYHQFVDAKAKGVNLIDAGHFPTEDPVCEEVIAYLQAQFPQVTIQKSTVHREVIQYYVEGV
ncbi:MAG: Nif3-like dinuclear metal center hexameric protein [Oscillibacter sp.]|nr:Nif3-like dinuclear metal center hexameric protein [Oscillibacter sp.]